MPTGDPRGSLSIVPLGGLGEFGMNMTALRSGESILVVDAGVLFPGPETPGVDLILPDFTYLTEQAERVKGIILTHGHEDHIGALAYLLKELPLVVYGTELTVGFCRSRLAEHGLEETCDLRVMEPGETIDIGVFRVEPIRVTHSMADSVALAIRTPAGVVLHSGDFKLDSAPVVGEPTDVERLAQIGAEGVLCLMSDSTNAEVPGRTGSESSLEPSLRSLIGEATARVFVVCFTSSTHRIQTVLDAAREHGRKVALVGRSMTDNVAVTIELSRLRAPTGLILSIEDLLELPREQQLFLTAGSQGEPMSALAQIALDNHRTIVVEPSDRVILSARVIPGNERAVSRVISNLFRLGADVFYPRPAPAPPVHVSGHGSEEELRTMLELTRPRYFLPIHGEWRQLYHHAGIARAYGLGNDEIFLAEDGDLLTFDEEGAGISEQVPAEPQHLDVTGLGVVDDCVLRDRRRLSASGVLIPMVALGQAGLADTAEILSCGFVENEAGDQLLSEAHEAMTAALRELPRDESDDAEAVEARMESALKRFFRRRSMRRPLIVPVVVVCPQAEEAER